MRPRLPQPVRSVRRRRAHLLAVSVACSWPRLLAKRLRKFSRASHPVSNVKTRYAAGISSRLCPKTPANRAVLSLESFLHLTILFPRCPIQTLYDGLGPGSNFGDRSTDHTTWIPAWRISCDCLSIRRGNGKLPFCSSPLRAPSSLLKFTPFVWQVISLLHVPLWKRGIEADF